MANWCVNQCHRWRLGPLRHGAHPQSRSPDRCVTRFVFLGTKAHPLIRGHGLGGGSAGDGYPGVSVPVAVAAPPAAPLGPPAEVGGGTGTAAPPPPLRLRQATTDPPAKSGSVVVVEVEDLSVCHRHLARLTGSPRWRAAFRPQPIARPARRAPGDTLWAYDDLGPGPSGLIRRHPPELRPSGPFSVGNKRRCRRGRPPASRPGVASPGRDRRGLTRHAPRLRSRRRRGEGW